MDRDQIRALLLRIVNEAGYRDLLIADPVYALAQASITFDPKDVPPGGVSLPPNDEIAAALEPLTDTVLAAKAHINALLCLSC